MSTHAHSHAHEAARRATAAAPTLSLLRLSAGARVLGAGLILAVLWALVLLTIGAGA
jgi:hypothetical protein